MNAKRGFAGENRMDRSGLSLQYDRGPARLRPQVVGFLTNVLVLSLLAASVLAGNAWAGAPVGDEPCAPCAASTARLTGLADYYATKKASVAANAARYTAMASRFTARRDAATVVYSARYDALATSYSRDEERGRTASAARYAALTGFHCGKERAGIEASMARWNAMAADFSLEEGDRARLASAARYERLAARYGGSTVLTAGGPGPLRAVSSVYAGRLGAVAESYATSNALCSVR